MLIIAFCPHYHLEGLRREGSSGEVGILRLFPGDGSLSLSLSAPRAGDRQKQMNSAPLLQILFRPQTPAVTFLRAAWTLPLRGLTGAKASDHKLFRAEVLTFMALPRWPMELIEGDEGNQFTWDSELVCFHSWPLSTSGSQSSLSSVLMQHPALCIQSFLDTHWLSFSGPYSPAPLLDLSLSYLFTIGFWKRGASCPSPILWSDILSPQLWDSNWGLFPQETQTEAVKYHQSRSTQPP